MNERSSKRLIVFGGRGFIGSNLIASALAQGWSVTSFARSPAADGASPATHDEVIGDSSRLDDCRRIVAAVKPTAIFVAISALTPRSATEANGDMVFMEVRSLSNILQAAHENGVTRIGFCSSGGAVYGSSPGFHKEIDPCAPPSLYGKMKLQCESLLTTICDNWSIDGFALRIGNPYGPGQSPHGLHGVIAKFAYQILKHQPIRIIGSPESEKDYVYIDDVSRAALAAFDGRARGIYNIASAKGTSIATLIEKIVARCGVRPNVEMGQLGSVEVSSFLLDVSKARRDFGWEPVTDLETGIDRTVAWIAETQLGETVG